MEAQRDRRSFIGGSDVSAILGISPWQTAYGLWEEKISPGPIISEENSVQKRGKRLEPVVIEMLQEDHDVWVTGRNQIHVDEELSFLRAEIDFEYVHDQSKAFGLKDAPEEYKNSKYACERDLVALPDMIWTPKSNIGNGDVKTVHFSKAPEWGDEGTDQIPPYYCAQFQHGMMVTGRKTCKVAALIGADDLRIYQVDRDDELIAEIRRREIEFWEYNVRGGHAPEPTSLEDAQKIIKKYQGFAWQVDEETSENIRKLRDAQLRKKEAEAEEKTLKTSISLAITHVAGTQKYEGDKYTFCDSEGKKLATWAKQSRAGYFVEPTEFMVLR